MKKLVGVLSVITLIFAGSTLFLANELRVELRRARELPAAEAPPHAQGTAPPDESSVVTDDPSAPVRASGPAQSVTSSNRAVDAGGEEEGSAPLAASASERDAERWARTKARRQRSATALLERYESPTEREKLLADARAQARKNLEGDGFPRLAGLTDSETNRLVDLLAQQSVDNNVKAAQCMLEPDCSPTPQQALKVSDKEGNRRQLADLLGPERTERYEQFQGSLGERKGVAAFRTRLPDDQVLASTEVERLIDVLARERQKFVSEVERAGGRSGSFSLAGAGTVFYRHVEKGQPSRNVVPGFSADLGSAEDYTERMKKSASQVLNAEQMRVFAEMQDELIHVLRQRLRNAQTRPTPPSPRPNPVRP